MARHELNFTKTALEQLRPPIAGERLEVFDSKTPGLMVRVSPTGVKTFYARRWIKGDGRAERITIGRFPACSVENARKAAGRINHAIAEGDNPAEAVREKKAELTLGEMFSQYIERYALPRGKKSVSAMREMWERYLGALPVVERKPRGKARTKHDHGVNWENKKLSAVKSADVMRLHADLGKAGVQTTANRVVELLSSLFNKAAEWSLYAGPNPAAKVEPFREVKRDRFIQADELPRFFAALATEPSKDVRDFVLLALLTGARRGNVLAMEWAHVSLDRSEWRIPETKNGETQTVPLTAEAIAVLKERIPMDEATGKKTAKPSAGFVFASVSKTGHIANPKKGWARVLKSAGIEDLRIHDLRRSLGSWQAKTGASLAIIGKSLGHKTASATMIYARLDQDPVRASMERATSAILKAGKLKASANVVPIKAKPKAKARSKSNVVPLTSRKKV